MKITLQTKSGTFTFDAEPGENLLYAGLRQGLTLPYECGTGTCGTCRARFADGETELMWSEAPGLARLRQDKGDILLCQAHAKSDCLARIPAEISDAPQRHHVPGYRHGVIDRVARLTHDVMHFEMTFDAPLSFEAGQFVTLILPGISGARAYSMINHATSTDRLSFVIKQKPDGGVSNWLFEDDRTGATVDLFGPLGQATFRPDESRSIVCIAGGSGIAGMMAILEHAVATEHFSKHRGDVFFGVRRLKDGFYLAELNALAARAGENLKITLALSDEVAPQEAHPHHPNIKLASGFVHEVAEAGMAGRTDDLTGYVAGPPPMVDGALKMLIAQLRLPPEFIRYDKFS